MIDSRKQFADLLRRVMTEVKAAFPIEGGPHRLTATNWRWTDYGDDVRDDLARHKQVKLRESSLVAKLLADLEVTDTKTGKTVDRRAGMTIARLPHITAKGGYIVEGKELQVVNQLRLRPGLYTRTTVDDNIETFVNTSAAGTYRVILERESSRFFFRVGVSARFALPSVLRCDGISDGAMRAAWGAKIYEASNDRVDDVREVRRLYAKLRPYGKAPAAPEAVRAEIAAFLASKPLDPEVNRITVQQPFEAVTGQALLAASVKCLQLSRGAVQPDDTESLAFKSIHSVEDFVPERIRQAVKGIQYAVASKLAREGKIASAFHPGLFSDPIAGFFSTSEFARFQDQSNPVEIVATNFLTTTMGEGGIGSTHAVTDAVRLVHPSHVGVLDPMQSPEGKKVGITGHLTLGARKVGNQLALPVIDVRTGAHEVRTLQELDHKVLAFPDQYDCTGKKPKALVTEVKGRQHTTIGVFKPSAVDYVLLDQHYLFSPTTNMVPFLNNDDGNRVGMADRHIEQTVPLKDPDSPRVMARFGAKGYEEVFGKAFLPLSPIAGKVRKVTDEAITVEAAGGVKHDVPIHRYYPLNSNTYLHDTPLVKPGDVVKKGQPLVENNFTRGGTLAMGKNLTVAYMPFRGLNFEDGMVISESAARKLTSIHKYEERLDRDARVQIGLKRLLAHYPDQAEKLGDRSRYDADGVVKPGAVMTHGELLIAAVREQQLHEDYDFARLHRALSHQWTDASIYWTGDPAGTVVDVVKTPRFIKVVLTTEEPAQVGDKLCFAPEHELLTRTGWKPVDEVTEFDQICTLNQQTQEIQYQYPTRVYRYDVVDEPMYDLRSQQVAMRVTMNHRLYVNRRGRVGYELLPAKSVLGTRVRFKKDGVWRGVTPALLLGFPTIPLMKLLGFYLAEGTRDREDWRIVFHQTKPEGRAWFKKVCAVLGLHYNEQPTRFAVHLKKLWLWLDKTGGLSWQKRIPSEVLSFGSDALAALWEGVLVGDGSVCKSGSELITTTSTVFRDQLQEVALKCGWSANCREQEADVPVGACRGTINGRALMKRHRVFTVRLVKAKNRPQLNHGHTKAQKGQTESVVRHTGPVYCVEVPNHVVYTQLDSKPHWSGNSHRAGGKGIVTHIVPDGEMYRNAKGEPIDLLFNPAGVPGRVNPGQLYEAAAGKLAKQRGSPYLVANFNRGGSTLDQVRAELKKAGMDEHGEETVTDPVSGRTFPRVLVGDTHFLKLKHAVSKKFSARDFGHGYTINEQPGRTEEGSAQRIGGLELFALLSGDAKHFVHDAFAIKGTRNDEYWRALQLGLPTPPPKTPFVAEKFNAFLLGAGVNLERRGTEIQARPLLDRDILAASNGAIRSPAVITANTLKPEKGGLFDPQITGGIGGHHWSHIELPEPVVNPLMTAAVRSVLQLTGKQVEGLLDGSQGVNDKGEVVANPDGKLPTGGVAIEDLLKRVVPARELAVVRAKLRATTSVARIDELNKRRRYLDALQAAGLAPADAYLNRVVAVVPPRFRAVYPLPDGSLNVSDPVHGYREVLMVANALRDMRTMGVDSAHYRQLRGDLQRSVSGLVGLTEPLTRGAHFKGFLSQVKGASNKDGFFQGRLMSRPQDLSARSTVVPDPTLGLDQIGIPEKMGLTVYKPFLVRRLVGLGHTPLEARELVEKGDPLAVKALRLEAAHRPVLMNRAPSLHKFNVLAFRPTIVAGEAVQVNPLIVGGYNMDFDGDSCHGDTPLCIARTDGKTSVMPHELLAIKDFPRGELVRNDRIKEYAVPDGTTIRSFDTKTRLFRQCAVTLFSVHPDCEEWEVMTRRGRTLKVSADASLATLDPDDLSVGATAPKDAVGRLMPELGLVPHGLIDRIAGPFGEVGLTEALGWLVGAHIGDGWSEVAKDVGPRAVCLSYGRRGEFIVPLWTEGMRALGFTNPTRHRALPHEFEGKQYTSQRLRISSTPGARWFHDLCGHGAANKHMPLGFDAWPFEARLGLLAGLLDTDGSVSVTRAGKRVCLLTTVSARLAEEAVRLARSLGVGASRTAHAARKENRQESWQVIFSGTAIGTLVGLNLRHPVKAKAVAAFRMAETERGDLNDRVPLLPAVKESLLAALRAAGASARGVHRNKSLFSRYNDLLRLKTSITRHRAAWYLAWADQQGVDGLEDWRRIVEDPTVAWDEVLSAKPTGNRVEMYDLTVPDTLTFCTADGLTLWDTVGIHVPVTEAARHEALEKSLASKNLFSPANDRVVPQPSGETILGLYLATLPIGKPTAVPDVKAMVALYRTKKAKANDAFTIDGKTTCPGVELVRAALPKGLTFDAPMTKQVMSKVIEKAAREFPKQAVDVINTLKTLGNQFVTEIGFSVSLRDLAIDTPARDAVLAKARAATGKLGFDTANQQALKALSQQVHGDHANRFVVLSSGSGALSSKAGQVTRMLATPVAVTDHRGQTIPVQIRKSYAEGFDLGSYWATMPGVRKGLMDKGLSTADTGYLTKLLVNANIDNVVSEADCQTTDGILMKLTEPDVVGRVVADGPYKGQLLTADRVRKLAERKVAELKMRSPLKCRSHAGTCQRCFGLGQDGKFYPIGFHLGVLAAQTIGEPSTQLALRTFHSGGAIGGRTPQGFKRVNQIFTMPDNVQHRQILAMTSGKVTKIVKAPAGGWDVTVAGRAHYVPQELGLRVKVGTAVQAGQPLSEGGVLRPQDLLEATGRIEQVRDAVINELSDNFKSSGVNIKRRIFETVVRPMTDRTTVTNPGSSDQVFVGDVLSHNRIEALNKTLDRKIEAEPTLLGIVKIPHLGDDFIGRMQHERLFDTMRQAPALGLKADFGPKGHPVTQLALTNIREVGLPKAGVPSRAVHR